MENTINACKGRWSMGGSALRDIDGAEIEPLVGTSADAELRLVGIIGHALRVTHRPSPPEGLTFSDLLPRLEIPMMPESSRRSFRRVIALAGKDRAIQEKLVWLAASRGYAVHPADWMPTRSGGTLPSVYAPWLDWIESGVDRNGKAPEEITAENWDEFFPAERLRLLTQLRLKSPKIALELIAAKALSEPAPKRLDLVRVLENRLNEADADFLNRLESDRSAKVSALAGQLLMRLGQFETSEADIDELIDFLDIGKSKGKPNIAPKSIRTNAQKKRRHALFQNLPISILARALKLEEDKQVVEAWKLSIKDTKANDGFVEMVINSGSQVAAFGLARKWCDRPEVSLPTMTNLCDRLSLEQRAEIASLAFQSRILTDDAVSWLDRSHHFAGNSLGFLPWKVIDGSKEYRDMIKLARVANGKAEKESRIADHQIEQPITTFGLLADQEASGQILDRLIAAGMMEADPRLGYLRFNSGLVAQLQRSEQP